MTGSPVVEFGVLGPLEVRIDGRPVQVPGARQQAILAELLINRGRVVPMDRLVDAVFGEEPPRDSRNALQTYVTRLRQALGPVGHSIRTRTPGYLIDPPAGAVDVDRFAALLDQARATSRPETALALLEQALALWRGTAYAELSSTMARGEALRLDELRKSAQEDRAALLLRLDRLGEATAWLEGITAEEPWRERPVELLVRALARAGRTGHALAALARHRTQLNEELGLDPSPALRQLEEQVLRGTLQPRPAEVRGGTFEPRRRRHARATSFVGREQELHSVRDALARGPLVTLVGPGGVGKTRLAEELAAERDGVWWVDLAPLREPDAVTYAIADAVGIELVDGDRAAEALGHWAGLASGLLVIDNCEHVLDPVAELAARLIAADSAVAVLATARERLGVDGEQVLVVSPLDTSATGGPAVTLFLVRARHAHPVLGDGDLPRQRVGDVCRALDGLPLAIELAAARIGSLTVDDLHDRLDARFDLVRTGRGTGDERHRTLRAVVDWSYDLLTVDEQRLFLRLSVFAADFDIAAAEVVAADATLPVSRIADLVARLAEQSVLTPPGASGVGRYRMLETLRAYADDRLDADEAMRVRRRHACFMVELAEQAETGLYGPDESTWARRIELWMDDLRAAWTWVRNTGETDLAVRLVAAMTRYAYWRVRTDILAWGSWVAATVSRHPRLAVALAAAATAEWMSGRPAEARDLARRGVDAGGGHASPAAAAALESVGDVAMVTGDVPAALAAYRDVGRLAGPTDPTGLAIANANLSLTLTYAGDAPGAAAAAEQAVAGAYAAGNATAIAMARFAQGEALTDGDPARALDGLDDAVRRAREVGNRFVAGTALTALVALRGRNGPPEEALPLFREAIVHWRGSGNRTLLLTTLRNLVILLARTGRDEAAASLAAALDTAKSRSYGIEAERLTTALAAVQRRLGAVRYERAQTVGSAWTIEAAADDAVRLIDTAAAGAGSGSA